jgi:23S rRNA (uracil1939-C5)-methyltransferase/tRNA (uracil-5-)-methyltransferase
MGTGVCKVPISDPDDSTVNDWVIFVPNTIPGELVKLRIFRNHKNYSDADLVQVVETSPDRVEPRCVLAGTCGGCQYQHMSIQAQRDWKRNQVQSVLHRIGGLTNVNVQPTAGTEHLYHYRSKITPHYDVPTKLGPNTYQLGPIGFQEKNSRRLVDVEYCHIATEAMNTHWTVLRQQLHQQARTGQLKRPKRGATLLLRDCQEQGVVSNPNQYVTAHVGGLEFRYLAGNFFQNNPYMLPKMVQFVVDAARQPNSSQKPMKHLIDCYCGSGLFCLSASSFFHTCVGIEVNDKAVEEAAANAKLNNITNCAFVAASAEAIFDAPQYNVQDLPRDQTVVVCDPPRKGCSPEFLNQVLSYQPQRIVYLSCDPATQARDTKDLCAGGEYTVTLVQPIDLFPQTRHIECLMVLERKKNTQGNEAI